MSSNLSAAFVADSRGLDFLNSITNSAEGAVDWLQDGAGLIDWLRQAGLVPEAMLAEITSTVIPGELDRMAEQARNLREWFRAFTLSRMGSPLDADSLGELAPLNHLLERDKTYWRIVAEGADHLALEVARRWQAPESLLVPIAEILARVVVEENFASVRMCDGPSCTLLFADHTRGGVRRWCSMSSCGNRAKVSAHRHRRRGDSPQSVDRERQI